MNEIMYGELGRIPLIVQRYIRTVKYWLKILNIKQTRLTKVLYNVQFNALTNNHTIVNWVSKVRNLLCSYGFGEAWYNQGVGDANIFLVLFKQRAIDLYLHDCFLNLKNSNKALLYRNIKVNIKLTQLRTRNHKLHVETGSWCKPRSTPFDERLCFICDRDELEDEYYFVLCCPAYTALRLKYIKKYYYQYPSMYKFTKLLTIENKIVLRKLAAYVYYAFKKRNEIAYINDWNIPIHCCTVLFYLYLTCAWQAMYLPLVNKHYYYGAKIIWSTKITLKSRRFIKYKDGVTYVFFVFK